MPCTLYVGLELCCVACTKRARRRATLSKWTNHAAISLAAIGVMTAFGVPAWQRWRHPEAGGPTAQTIEGQIAEVVAHPCEPGPLKRLVTTMLTAGDTRGAGVALDQSLSFCRFGADMHVFAFDTHLRVGDARAAVRDATRLSEAWPGFPQPYESRAMAHELLGETDEAAADREAAARARTELEDILARVREAKLCKENCRRLDEVVTPELAQFFLRGLSP